MEYGRGSLCDGDSVLIGRKGTLDNPLYLDHPFWPVDTTYFTSNFNGSMRWFYYLIQTVGLSSLNEATGVPSLSRQTFYNVEVLFPPLEEQTAIAEVLATVDRAIEQTEALIAKQRRIKAGLLHDLLTRGIDEKGNLRDPSTHRFKPSPVGLVPEEWEVGKIANFFSMELGKMLSKASKKNVFPKHYLANKNVQWGQIDISDLDTMDFYPHEQFRYRLRTGDILVCEGGEVGRTALWNDELDECYFQKAIHRLRPLSHRITPLYMMYYMQFVVPIGVLLKLTTQTSIAHLTQEQLAVSPITFPLVDEMERIASVLSKQDEMIKTMEIEMNKLHRLKSGLMQDLLSGRVSVAGLLRNEELSN